MAIVGRAKYTRARESSRRRLLEISRVRVYFVRPTIATAKIRDYSQSNNKHNFLVKIKIILVIDTETKHTIYTNDCQNDYCRD